MLSLMVTPGITTKALDRELEVFIRDHGAKPAFKGLKGDASDPYPACGCYSVNEVVVHGMPSERELQEGEIIGIDVGVEMEGFFGDAARTFPVGNVNFDKKRLIQTAQDAFWKGMEVAKPGNHLFDISYKIQKLTEGRGFSVVKALVGHGIGRKLHEDPQIPNYGSSGTGPLLRSGMVLAVEPMINAGTYEVEVMNDGWTIVTADKKLSAHYENTILITDNKGPEILTIEAESD
jgi:methionyl aminopeptidase